MERRSIDWKLYNEKLAKIRTILTNWGYNADSSGIYLWQRYNEENNKVCAYVGLASNLATRTLQHYDGYGSHLDKSLKIHPDWKITEFYACKIEELKDLEVKKIEEIQKEHPEWVLYNIQSGGTNEKGNLQPNERHKYGLLKEKWRMKCLNNELKIKEIKKLCKTFNKKGSNSLQKEISQKILNIIQPKVI
jgi:hypothetical protein